MMLQAIKKQMKLQYENWIVGLFLAAGGAVFGIILLQFIMRIDGDVKNYVPLGTILGGIMGCMYYAITMLASLQQEFNIQISMGCTRRHFIVSYYLSGFVGGMTLLAFLLLLETAEGIVYPHMFPLTGEGVDFRDFLLRYGVLIVTTLICIGGLWGVLIMRFGKKAGWVLWAIWMFACLGLPRINEAVHEAPDSVFGKIGIAVGDFCQAAPAGTWGITAVAVSIGSLVLACLLLRKQQVTM